MYRVIQESYVTGHASSYEGPNKKIVPDPVSLALVVTKNSFSSISSGSIVVRQSVDITIFFISLKVVW